MLLWPCTHWPQSRKDVRHSGNRVERTGEKSILLATKWPSWRLSTATSCRIRLCRRCVAKTGNKSATEWTMSLTKSSVLEIKLKVSATVDFVASFCDCKLFCQCVPGLLGKKHVSAADGTSIRDVYWFKDLFSVNVFYGVKWLNCSYFIISSVHSKPSPQLRCFNLHSIFHRKTSAGSSL